MSGHSPINLKSRIKAISRLGEVLSVKLSNYDEELKPVAIHAHRLNPWFTERFIKQAISEWIEALKKAEDWLTSVVDFSPKSLTIGVVNAGNIPFVGLHDFLTVLVSGHNYQGKNATGDDILLPYIAQLIIDIEPAFKDRISFVDRLIGIDAVIATGSNNSARYFEYYFGKYPHVIRKNRNGVAVLTGEESNEELFNLGKDVFSYFGLGCRNVSKLYVPAEYNFNKFFEAMFNYSFVNESSKYMNNFEYNNSVLLLKRIPFLQNEFLIIREEKNIPSPISVVHYERYSDSNILGEELLTKDDQLQCIVAGKAFYEKYHELKKITIPFGSSQSPALWDYADGVDTLKFLNELSRN